MEEHTCSRVPAILRKSTDEMFAAAFHKALRDNDVDKAQKLLENNDYTSAPHYLILEDAINFGHARIVDLLLDKGCNVNQRNYKGATPLHSAMQQLCENPTIWTDIVVKMIEKGAYLGFQDDNGNTPLHLAFLKGATGGVMDFLLELYVQPFQQESVDFDQVFQKIVLSKGRVNRDKLSIYHIACTRPHLDNLKTLASHGMAKKNDRVSIKSKSPYAGYSPLHFAVANCQYEVVKVLLADKPQVFAVDKNNSTPLHLAVRLRDGEMIGLLLPHYRVNKIDMFGYTHFMAACTSSDPSFVVKYIQVDGKSSSNSSVSLIKDQVKMSDANLPFAGYTPLHFAVVCGNHKVVDVLLKNDADIYAQDVNGSTPLHLALYRRDQAMIDQLLVEDVFLMDFVDTFGATHFMAACAGTESSIVREFLRVAAIRMESSQQTFINAEIHGNVDVYTGYTPLHFAVEFGNYEVVQLLLDHDADLYAHNVSGSTPLHLALECCNTRIIDLLLMYDEFTENLVNNSGLSHFMVACAGSELAIVKEYLRVSELRSWTSTSSLVNSSTLNDSLFWYAGYSPLNFAIQFGRVDIVDFLSNELGLYGLKHEK